MLRSYKKQNSRKGVDWMLSERKKKENLEELTIWNRSESCFPQVQMNHEKKNESEKVFQVAQVPLGAEHGERRVEHQRHKMSSEGRPKKLQILELTNCTYVRLFVDSHPKFTCPKQSISGSHIWPRTKYKVMRKVQIAKRQGKIGMSGNEADDFF